MSTEGSLYLFDCATDATGSVSATSTIQFVSKATELATPSPLPVLGACFVSGESVRVAHSSQVQPCFEDIVRHPNDTCVSIIIIIVPDCRSLPSPRLECVWYASTEEAYCWGGRGGALLKL